jgi:hypothetical protein
MSVMSLSDKELDGGTGRPAFQTQYVQPVSNSRKHSGYAQIPASFVDISGLIFYSCYKVLQLQSVITGKMNMKRCQMTAAAAMDWVY